MHGRLRMLNETLVKTSAHAAQQDNSVKNSLSLAQQAFESIKQLIFNFELIPGERFSEADLTQRLINIWAAAQMKNS